MLYESFLVLLMVAVIGCGLVAGFFLTFSDFLMRSFAQARPGVGIEVMQIVNREVWRSITIFLLWGMLALSMLLTVLAFSIGNEAVLGWVYSGTAFYVAGVLLVSYGYNIPMNKQLDVHHFADIASLDYWNATYVRRWSFWNLMRAITSASAAVCFLIAAIKLV